MSLNKTFKKSKAVVKPIKLKIKRGDTVQIIAGSDKGKKGEVKEVNNRTLQIMVDGVAIKTHFDKKVGEIHKKEGFIDYSNVKLVEVKKPVAIKAKKATASKKA